MAQNSGRKKVPKMGQREQSALFIESAKKTGADESGKPFEKAFKKIVKSEKKPIKR